MKFLLSSDNVADYLVNRQLLSLQDAPSAVIFAEAYKNFNLVVKTADACLIVKQGRSEVHGDNCRFWWEKRVYDLFREFAELHSLLPLTSEAIHFDSDNSILVLRYFSDHCNLGDFYSSRDAKNFPIAIASSVGRTLAKVHSMTWGQDSYQAFLELGKPSDRSIDAVPNFLQGLERFGPGIFSKISADGLDFWRLYQRYESLHQAVVTLVESYQSSCLIHDDLEFRNILVNGSSFNSDNITPADINLKLIDWEFFRWGDPAFDLGTILSSYLNLWLDSLIVSKAIPIQTTLKLAKRPLELLQPSMTALVRTYLAEFPAILNHQPCFINRVLQFTGLILIKQIQGKMEHLYPFDNTCICTLQVAKMMLCSPEQSFAEIFGSGAANLMQVEGVLSC